VLSVCVPPEGQGLQVSVGSSVGTQGWRRRGGAVRATRRASRVCASRCLGPWALAPHATVWATRPCAPGNRGLGLRPALRARRASTQCASRQRPLPRLAGHAAGAPRAGQRAPVYVLLICGHTAMQDWALELHLGATDRCAARWVLGGTRTHGPSHKAGPAGERKAGPRPRVYPSRTSSLPSSCTERPGTQRRL
jgi:hypothetical protein